MKSSAPLSVTITNLSSKTSPISHFKSIATASFSNWPLAIIKDEGCNTIDEYVDKLIVDHENEEGLPFTFCALLDCDDNTKNVEEDDTTSTTTAAAAAAATTTTTTNTNTTTTTKGETNNDDNNHNSIVIGSITLTTIDIPARPELTPWLASLWVDPIHQNNSLSKKLITRLLQEASIFTYEDGGDQKYKEVYLYVKKSHEFGVTYYGRFGFQAVEEYLHNEAIVVIMKKDLIATTSGT